MLPLKKIITLVAVTTTACIISSPVWSAQNFVPGAYEDGGGATVGNPVTEGFTFTSAHDVFQFSATTSASTMTIATEDCCIVGDKWITRTICLQNNAVTDVRGKGNGSTSKFTGQSKVYKNGSQGIDCLVEVRYGQGVATFPAGMSVKVDASGGAPITTTILTTLKPLTSH